MWANIKIFFTALPIIWKFWKEFKSLFAKISKMKHEWEIRKFVKDLEKASNQADVDVDENGNTTGGDTSGYEDIIRKG